MIQRRMFLGRAIYGTVAVVLLALFIGNFFGELRKIIVRMRLC